jgi:preprotein translocase subunit SecA
MNQQREVIYSLRTFALEGGEELKGEARKMMEKALDARIETTLVEYESVDDWDMELLRQELLMHYLLTVPEFADDEERPISIAEAQEAARAAGHLAFDAKLKNLGEYADQLLSLVMLNVLDEKWKDHLYDLDQLRAAIHYRSWGQTDPLIEYKKEAYQMFVDLMADIYSTFTERFLRVQLVFNPPPEMATRQGGAATQPGGAGRQPARPTKRYNALGILEDVPAAEPDGDGDGAGVATTTDIGPTEPPKSHPAARPEPTVVGAGRTRTLRATQPAANADWSSVGRNDPCPCGSGKKYKKCHGANV